jgi:hypothetical protein
VREFFGVFLLRHGWAFISTWYDLRSRNGVCLKHKENIRYYNFDVEKSS